ncbi:hypothetical protein AA0114_g12376 [Alternaria tenuissima]|uniref:Meiotic expression up-regulated protein 6 PH domain-containing protein n=1 Tax=Alternaria tenuissima TaxID=119927 RepID=A0A4V1WL16_9PLEO|nr:hypothetical protein AA0114_g12376 [Alternaria tenuissima]
MSAPVDAPKPVEVPEVGTAGTVEPAPAPVVATEPVVAAPVAEEAPKTEEVPKTEGEAVAAAPVEEVKEEKVVEPIYSGALGYKAPGLKNAFRFAKKYFWFGEEPVAADNLREYLRGEKPEVAHPVAAWSSQTGKGLLFFVKHADQKEHPAGVLNLAYATDLAKDGAVAFAFKISGHKHTFEATTAAERDGWFVAVEKAITEAKASKDTIESSEGYKENKEKIGKPTALAGATSSAPKKSMDATPKLAEGETAVAGEPVAARAGSSSSSSSDEEKRKKAAKSKSRSVSRGKRASLFGGLLGKKDKEPKEETDAVKTEPEVKTEEPAAVPAVVPHLDEIPATTPVNANDVTHPAETTTEPTAVVAVPTEEAPKVDEAAAPVTQEKPKPQKRGSIFGSFVEKLKSPTTEKKEHEAGLAATPVKENETIPEASKPLEEAQVAAPVVPETTTTATEPVVKPEEVKAVSTPSKEKDHFKFGKFFGSKDRAKSPAPEPKVDAAAPQIADTTAEPVQAVEPVPVAETKVEATPETEAPKQDKRKSFFGNLGRSLSKATGNKAPKDKKEAVSPAPVTEEETAAPVVEEKKEETATPVVGDVPAEASVADASKSANPTVATTA